MEKIKINDIKRMTTKANKYFWVVKYSKGDADGGVSGEATIGAWDSQLADYIEKDVGIGGTVSVLIEQKGNYTNITEVDMTSAVKGEEHFSTDDYANAARVQMGKEPILRTSGLMSPKDIMIVSQCLTKCAVELKKTLQGTKMETILGDVLDAYRFFVLELEQNG